MNIEEFREYCLLKKAVSEDTPFGPDTLVFKVLNKVFALTSIDNPEFRVNLKCEPNYAIELREKYDFIIPGYHMNKVHWNTVLVGQAGDKLVKTLIDHSYEQVMKGFSKKEKMEYDNLIS
jgi:predicted DNA-binding protein (MmcQ/YjbR family)